MKKTMAICFLALLISSSLYASDNLEAREKKHGLKYSSFLSERESKKLILNKNEALISGRGTTWNAYPLYGGEMTSIANDPNNPQIVYVGTRDAGVFRTTDGGASWLPARDGLTFYPIRSLGIDPDNSAILYAGTDYDGVWKSTDSGATWFKSSTGLDESMIIFNIIVDPQNPNTLYAGLAGGVAFVIGNIYKSTDGALNWKTSDSGLPSYDEHKNAIFSLAIDPDNSGVLYAGTNYDGAYMSTDTAKTWSAINDSLPYMSYPDWRESVCALAIDTHNSNRLSAIFSGIEGGYYIFNDSNHWVKTSQGYSGLGQMISDLSFHSTDSMIIYSAGGLPGFSKSIDAGANWEGKQAGIDLIAINPACPDTIYGTVSHSLSVDGGVYKSIDQGENWNESSNGITSKAIRSVAIDRQNIANLYAGDGNGQFYRSDNGGTIWYNEDFDGGEITDIEIDPANSANIYLADFTGLYKSNDTGKTFTDIDEVMNPFCIDVNPSAPNLLYVGGGNGIYKTTDGGTTWVEKNEGLPGDTIFGLRNILSIAIDPNDTSVIWTGTDGLGGILKTTDGGEHWVGKGLTEELSVNCIATNPDNSNEILVGTDGYYGSIIYKSINGGDTWVKKDSLIPSVFEIKYDPRDPQFVYAATEGYGVCRSTDGGETWYNYSDGIFYPLVYSLDIAQGDSALLIAGSYGSGLYYIHPELSGIEEQKIKDKSSFLQKSSLLLSGKQNLIQFNLPKAGIVSLKLYDIMGRQVTEILNEHRPAGRNEATWSTEKIPSGIYFYNLEVEGARESSKVTFIK
jgi:photosystem II stability/assembly factor-like uncharacterized protein